MTMKMILTMLAGAMALGVLSSCGECDCNRPNRELLYGPPSSSRSF